MLSNGEIIAEINTVLQEDAIEYGGSDNRLERSMLDLAQRLTGRNRDYLKRVLRIGDLPEDLVLPEPVKTTDTL